MDSEDELLCGLAVVMIQWKKTIKKEKTGGYGFRESHSNGPMKYHGVS